jgi:hypothetical protein
MVADQQGSGTVWLEDQGAPENHMHAQDAAHAEGTQKLVTVSQFTAYQKSLPRLQNHVPVASTGRWTFQLLK